MNKPEKHVGFAEGATTKKLPMTIMRERRSFKTKRMSLPMTTIIWLTISSFSLVLARCFHGMPLLLLRPSIARAFVERTTFGTLITHEAVMGGIGHGRCHYFCTLYHYNGRLLALPMTMFHWLTILVWTMRRNPLIAGRHSRTLPLNRQRYSATLWDIWC
jgi:hypothetical protein